VRTTQKKQAQPTPLLHHQQFIESFPVALHCFFWLVLIILKQSRSLFEGNLLALKLELQTPLENARKQERCKAMGVSK
jgi:hypothetical protein